MALRLIDIMLPADQASALRELLEGLSPQGVVDESLADGRMLLRLLLEAERTGPVVDGINDRFGHVTGFRLLIMPVEAALPRPQEPEPPPEEEPEPAEENGKTPEPAPTGVNREELYDKTLDMTKMSRTFIATVVLSTLVAAVGILRDNVAVIIGAMVIAPLLGPNVALALATTLGDFKLMKQTFRSLAVGFIIALALTVALGLVLTIDPAGHELASRTAVHLSDIVLALAAGSAGALALTAGVPSALVGVMVAVALLPPTVALGLMLGSGHWNLAGGATLLLLTNVICVNLAGVVTFLWQGVRPRTWWEADRAKRSARIALTIWIGLLIVLAGLIVIAQGGR